MFDWLTEEESDSSLLISGSVMSSYCGTIGDCTSFFSLWHIGFRKGKIWWSNREYYFLKIMIRAHNWVVPG